MDKKELDALVDLTSRDEISDVRKSCERYGGMDIADVRGLLEKHTERVVTRISAEMQAWKRLALARRGLLECDVEVFDEEEYQEALEPERQAMLALVELGFDPNYGGVLSEKDKDEFVRVLNEPHPDQNADESKTP